MNCKKKFALLCVSVAVFMPQTTAHSSSINHGSVASYSALQETQTPRAEEEIEVTGDRVLEQLRSRLQEGFSAYMKGNFAEAEKQFSSEIKIDGNYMQRQVENLRHMTELMNVNRPVLPSLSTDQRIYLGAVYYMRGMSQARQGKTDSAKISMRKAIKINAKNFDARVDYALLELQSGNLKLAEKQIKKLRKLLKKCKNVTVGHCNDLGNRFAELQIVYTNTSVN